MLRVDIHAARPGMVLAMPVCHPRAPAQTLLRIGYALEREAIARLTEMGVHTMWIHFPGLEQLDRYIDPRVLEAQGQLLHDVAEGFEAAGKRSAAKLSFDQYARSMSKLITSLVNNPQAAVFLGALEGGGQSLMRHSSTVAFLSVLMGLKLEGYLVQQRKHIDPLRAKEVTSLGVGAIVHDIGLLRLDPAVRAHYEKTGDDTDPQFRRHTTIGYEMVRGHIDPSAATTVLNHHQRFDGSGYGGDQVMVLEGERIHIFPRIVGLADYFDDMQNPIGVPAPGSSGNPGSPRKPVPAVKVLGHLLQDSIRQKFDPRVLQTLFAVAPAYPPGAILRLSDGRYAVTVENHPNEPCRPVVQIIPPPEQLHKISEQESETVDLTDDRGISIIACDGQDVAADNFNLPLPLRSDQLAATWSAKASA